MVELLPPSVASSLVPKNRSFIDHEYGYDFEFETYEVRGMACTRDELSFSQSLVEVGLKPSDRRVVVSELARLRVVTKAKAENDTNLEMLAQVYTEEMECYPPDIVRGACRAWGRREKWWPSWAELKHELDRAMKRRKALAYALSVDAR